MKTAISLPDKVFREAEHFARRTKKSRSQLYAEAITEYIARHSSNEVTDQINEICDRLAPMDEAFRKKAARKVVAAETW